MALVVVDTHPVQYKAPVYRAVQAAGVPVTALYGSDFSVAGYADAEFGVHLAWDKDLLSGYTPVFLSRRAAGGAANAGAVVGEGMRTALRRLRPRAVLLSGYTGPFYRRAIRTALSLRLLVLLRAETTDHAKARPPMKAALRDGALRMLYRRIACGLYIGSRSFTHYRRLGMPEERLIPSPYCVSTAPFRLTEEDRVAARAAVRERLGLTPRHHVWIYAGKLSERKGVDVLMAAAKKLPVETRARTALLFLGDGALRPALEAEAGREPALEARFVGFQPQHALSDYYHAADGLVLPSRWGETWGLVVNEGLHHGLPCVVSDQVGSAPDLIDEGATGSVVPAGSAEALAAAMDVWTNAWRDDPSWRGRLRWKVSRYSVASAAEGIVEGYARATGSLSDRGGDG